ncbi:VOC family protein [Hyphomonas chukchiensis]|nr:VOC family protein [Hyphomonas chukchiensis]
MKQTFQINGASVRLPLPRRAGKTMARISGNICQVGKDEELEPELSIALVFSASPRMELNQHHSQALSTYLEFRQRFCQGLHHLCGRRVDGFDDAISLSKAAGISVNSEGKMARRSRLAYLATDLHPGEIIEIGEASAKTEALFREAHAAASWYGVTQRIPVLYPHRRH